MAKIYDEKIEVIVTFDDESKELLRSIRDLIQGKAVQDAARVRRLFESTLLSSGNREKDHLIALQYADRAIGYGDGGK